MRTINLELDKMNSLPALHKYLHRALNLPEYYGANLDALYDCLTEIAEPTKLIISRKVAGAEYLGWYGQQLLTVLADASAENESLEVVVEE